MSRLIAGVGCCVGIVCSGSLIWIVLIQIWFVGEIVWFFGSVPVVVLVLVEQLEGLGGLGEDADGLERRTSMGRYRLARRGCRRSGRWWL